MELPVSRPLLLLLLFLFCLGAERRGAAEGNNPLATLEVVRCMTPLENPTLDNAVAAAKALRQLADSQRGPAKAATEKLITEVRNLFYSELVLINAQKNLPAAEQRAQDKAKSAQAWLRPNAMGTVNHTAYRNELEEAERIRSDAHVQVTQARERLRDVLQTTKAAVIAYERAGEHEVRSALEGAAQAVLARSLPEMSLSFPASASPSASALGSARGSSALDMEIDSSWVAPMMVGGLIVLAILLRRLHPAAE